MILTKVKCLYNGFSNFTQDSIYIVLGWGDNGGNTMAFVIDDNGDVGRASVDNSTYFELSTVEIIGNVQIYP